MRAQHAFAATLTIIITRVECRLIHVHTIHTHTIHTRYLILKPNALKPPHAMLGERVVPAASAI